MVLVLSFIAFSLFIQPLELFSDGTEFSIAASCLGIPHPPSYPVYVLFSRLFYLLPLGNAAFRLNCCSAFFAACTLYVIYRCYEGGWMEKLFLCLFVALLRTFFENAANGEVYSLNVLFFFLIYFMACRIKDRRFLYLAAFVLGLGLGNHHTIIFTAVFLIAELFRQTPRPAFKVLLTALFWGILGLSVYLYLPLRAAMKPRWDWGAPASLHFFVNSLLRGDFGHAGYLRPPEILWAQVRTLNLFSEIGLLNTGFVILSMVSLALKESGRFTKLMLLLFSYSLLMIFLLGNDNTPPDEMRTIYSVFFVPAYCVMGLIAADCIKNIVPPLKSAVIAVLVAAAAYNCANLAGALREAANGTFAHDLARAELSMLPRDSVLVIDGGEKDFPLLYQQKVSRFREDVRLVNLATLGRKWNGRESLELGLGNIAGYGGETDEKKNSLRGVVLFQNTFHQRPVFAFASRKAQLPESLAWNLNGLFWSHPETDLLDMSHVRIRSLSADDAHVMEDIIYSNTLSFIEKGMIAEGRSSLDLLRHCARDRSAVNDLSRRLGL